MASSSVSGSRSRQSGKAVRSHRSRTSTRSKTKKSSRSDTKDEETPVTPDVSELRSSRVAYYSLSAAERDQLRSKKPATTSKVVTSSRSSSRSTKRPESIRRSSSSSKFVVTRRKPRTEGERRTEKYVYETLPSPPEPLAGPNEEHRRDRSPRSSSPRRSLSPVDECDIGPDDSVSVAGTRRRRKSTSSRTSLQRSRTTPSKLAPVAESPVEESASTAKSASKASKRNSFLGNLLRRNAAPAIPSPPRLVGCLTCGADDIPSTRSAKLPCGHRMCHDCLKRVFEMSVKDPAHMPPKCCTPNHIPLKHVEKLFDLRFKKLWNRKFQEYHTKNRIYCPAPKCGHWIKPAYIKTAHGRKYATCPRCNLKVCTLCNHKLHKSSECPKDPEILRLVEQAKEKGWQSCYNCNAMVELREGCNHMTCRCRAQFCMICGSKWKTCDCPWFNHRAPQDGDQLNDMRVPDPLADVFARLGLQPPRGQPPQHLPGLADDPQPRAPRTYNNEMRERRLQEVADEQFALRMQRDFLLGRGGDDSDTGPAARPRRHAGVGNAAGHFMNDDFVQNAAHVVMGGFGDPAMGRRGTRSAGRRRESRVVEDDYGDGGLAPNFLGDASVLGIPARARSPRRR